MRNRLFVTFILSLIVLLLAVADVCGVTEIEILKEEWNVYQKQIDVLVKKQEEIHEKAEKIRSDLCRGGSYEYCPPIEIFVTSYNPEVGQTDGSPCTGAAGKDLCLLYKEGIKPMALSQDLVGRKSNKRFTYGDTVRMVSEISQCNGDFVVLDTMNKRFTNMGDLFFPERSLNTSCKATIIKVIN